MTAAPAQVVEVVGNDALGRFVWVNPSRNPLAQGLAEATDPDPGDTVTFQLVAPDPLLNNMTLQDMLGGTPLITIQSPTAQGAER